MRQFRRARARRTPPRSPRGITARTSAISPDALPRHRGLERVAHRRPCARARRGRRACAGTRCATRRRRRRARRRCSGMRRDAAVAGGQLDRVGQIAVDRDAGGLEAQHEHALLAVARAGELRLALVEDAAVRGPQARLRDLAQGVQRGEQVVEHDARRRALRRARAHAHPRLGDHAERALGAEQQPVGRRPGAGAGQPPRRVDAARRQRPDRLGEVVDVGLDGGEMAARAGRQPAAEGRELEALRVVAQRQAALAQLSPRAPGPARRPGSARRG